MTVREWLVTIAGAYGHRMGDVQMAELERMLARYRPNDAELERVKTRLYERAEGERFFPSPNLFLALLMDVRRDAKPETEAERRRQEREKWEREAVNEKSPQAREAFFNGLLESGLTHDQAMRFVSVDPSLMRTAVTVKGIGNAARTTKLLPESAGGHMIVNVKADYDDSDVPVSLDEDI